MIPTGQISGVLYPGSRPKWRYEWENWRLPVTRRLPLLDQVLDQVAFLCSPDGSIWTAFVGMDMCGSVPLDAGHRMVIVEALAQVAGLSDVDGNPACGGPLGEDIVTWYLLEACVEGVDKVSVFLSGCSRPVLLLSGGSHFLPLCWNCAKDALNPNLLSAGDLTHRYPSGTIPSACRSQWIYAPAVDSTKGPGICSTGAFARLSL